MNAPEVNSQIRNLLACQYELRRVTKLNAELLELCKRVANDDGLNDLIQGIGESPTWWSELRAVIAKAERGGL